MTGAINVDDVVEAERRIATYIHHTPVMPFPRTIVAMIRDVGGPEDLDVRAKCENFQRVGAFKARGAFNAVGKLKELHPELQVVVAHSSGNHAQGWRFALLSVWDTRPAVAYAARYFGILALIVVPNGANAAKLEATRAYGAEVVFCVAKEREATCHRVAEEHRERLGQRNAVAEISAFNHPFVMAGQGTVGLEALKVHIVGNQYVPIIGLGRLRHYYLSYWGRRAHIRRCNCNQGYGRRHARGSLSSDIATRPDI